MLKLTRQIPQIVTRRRFWFIRFREENNSQCHNTTHALVTDQANYCYKTANNKIETKVRGITLNCTDLEKVNLYVIRVLLYLTAICNVEGRVTVDIPFKITRYKHSKDIVPKRQKKDYQIVYNKRVIINDYKTIPYGY